MEKTFRFTVNGESRSVTTDSDRSLLEVLREEFHLTGAKYGCGEGQCLACTVHLNGKSVPACLTPVADADQQSVLTIEGLSKNGKLHPVQEVFLAESAFQCGYCTAGMIMGVIGVQGENPEASEKEVLNRMQKHLCRCCAYERIVKAIERCVKK